jgi:hypothetical protein
MYTRDILKSRLADYLRDISIDNIQASTNSVANTESLYYILKELELLKENT